jgi:ATP-binding cassette subfamily C protein
VTPAPPGAGLFKELVRRYFGFIAIAGLFSAVINTLYLTPSIFMLQVYDRVIPTGSVPTLVLLGLVAMAGLSVLSVLDWLRSRVLLKLSARLDLDLAAPLLSVALSRKALSRSRRQTVMLELAAARAVLSNGVLIALFDVPWVPIYIGACALLNPWMGVFSAVLAVIVLLIAWASEHATAPLYKDASRTINGTTMRQAQVAGHAMEISALGMVDAMRHSLEAGRMEGNVAHTRASFVSAAYSGWARFVRLAAQSLALGLAAFLAVRGDLSAGAISVATLMMGRALQPIEMLVGGWSHLLRGKAALAEIEAVLASADRRSYTALPLITGSVSVENLAVASPDMDRQLIGGINFTVAPGDAVAIVGLSGSGKSTLMRAIAGAALPLRGAVRFDGASTTDWDPQQLGRQIGYMPQERVFFSGTIKDNIARFETVLAEHVPGLDANDLDAKVIAAAVCAGAHDMILRLPAGYDTKLGHDGIGLSGGQAQRIALARAYFGRPRLMLLDEPCANLDTEGKAALLTLIESNKANGVTTLFTTHDRGIAAFATHIALMVNGTLASFAPNEQIVAPEGQPAKASPSFNLNRFATSIGIRP